MAAPEWIDRLCRTPFFRQCNVHVTKSAYFCLDTPMAPALCASCVPWISNMRLLQVRRRMYRDAVRTDDIALHFDVTGVQEFTANGRSVVYINPTRGSWPPGASNPCGGCRKALPEGLRHCSIRCKHTRSVLDTRSVTARVRPRKQSRPRRLM